MGSRSQRRSLPAIVWLVGLVGVVGVVVIALGAPGGTRRAGGTGPRAMTGQAVVHEAGSVRAPMRATTRSERVGVAVCALVDPSRPTYDYATGTSRPGRTLLTEIRYPTLSDARADPAGEVRNAPPERPVRPRPAIVFSPGYDVTPAAYVALLDAWVRAGFVVIAPTFPDTNPTAVAAAPLGNPEADVVNQPADVAFVLRTALRASLGGVPGCRVLRGMIDPSKVGLAGQSDGGDTVAMLAYDQASADTGLLAGLDVRAAAVLSGSEFGEGPFGATPHDPALLVVQSATDRCNPPQESTELYNTIVQPDKWFLALRSADHLGPYDASNPAAFSSVVRVTIRFFRLELGGGIPGAGFLAYSNTTPGVSELSSGPTAPSLAPLSPSMSACARR